MFDRRTFLSLTGLGIAIATTRSFGAPTPSGDGKKVLVVLLQRGAVDGLSMVVPMADPAYHALRPTVAIAKPLALDARFGLHPALAPLMPFWSKGALAFVHAVGSPDATRSHFDAQDYLETGTPGTKATEEGWLSRTLGALPKQAKAQSVRAVALQPTMPRILRGDAPAVAFASIADFHVGGSGGGGGSFESLYEGALDEALRGAGHEAFEAIHTLDQKKIAALPPEHGASYPTSPLGKRIKQIAQLIRGDVGVELAVTDCGGWDTHANQGATTGALAKRLEDLAQSFAAFVIDLGPRMADVCVVTATEFGRTAKENGTGGTDHGHGSVMCVLGGAVKGKRVVGKFPGLAKEELHEGRDLEVTTDHRDVFASVLRGHLGVKDTTKIFPGYTPSKLDLF